MAVSQEAVQENLTRARYESRGAESALTGREITPRTIVPSAESLALATGRRYRGFAVFGIGRIPMAAVRVEAATIGGMRAEGMTHYNQSESSSITCRPQKRS